MTPPPAPLSPRAARFGTRLILAAIILGAGAVAAATSPAGAQPRPTAPDLQPPVPTPPSKPPSTLIEILEAIVLAGLIIGVNFIPSKRGHQD